MICGLWRPNGEDTPGAKTSIKKELSNTETTTRDINASRYIWNLEVRDAIGRLMESMSRCRPLHVPTRSAAQASQTPAECSDRNCFAVYGKLDHMSHRDRRKRIHEQKTLSR